MVQIEESQSQHREARIPVAAGRIRMTCRPPGHNILFDSIARRFGLCKYSLLYLNCVIFRASLASMQPYGGVRCSSPRKIWPTATFPTTENTHPTLWVLSLSVFCGTCFSLSMTIHKSLACSSSTTESKRMLETPLSAAASHV
jgi:hypothetical protein